MVSYLPDEATHAILFTPVKTNIFEAFGQLQTLASAVRGPRARLQLSPLLAWPRARLQLSPLLAWPRACSRADARLSALPFAMRSRRLPPHLILCSLISSFAPSSHPCPHASSPLLSRLTSLALTSHPLLSR
eukprot:5541211-Prymnesium_polylepis.1